MNHTISEIIRSHRRTIALIITPDARLVVRAPVRTSLREIESIVEQKHDWITKKIRIAEKKQEKNRLGPFVEGHPFLFMGTWYPMALSSTERKITIKENRLIFPERFLNNPERALMHWYAHEALNLIASRVEYFASRHGFSYTGITITAARRRWGSCSHLNRLSFSWRLIRTPAEVIDYVVVHELCHTVVKDHSRNFWNKVQSILPDYKVRQRILKEF
jgi:predicted metal-dependent hydrolase